MARADGFRQSNPIREAALDGTDRMRSLAPPVQHVRLECVGVRSTAALTRSPSDTRCMTTPAFIAILDFATSPTQRQAAIAQLEHEQPAVCAMRGCIAFRVFSSRQNETDITVVHEWIDQASFDEYLTSDAFARSGEVLRPMLTGTPLSRRFRVELVDTAA